MPLSRIALTTFLISLMAGGLAAQGEEDPFEGSSLRDILGAIREFESKNDAKCQATATRLENFMFGTPLTDEARFEKVRLQKEMIAGLWRRAGAAAAADGRREIGLADVVPLTGATLAYTENEAGDVEIDLGERGRMQLTATEIRQYSSVAYSLRAVLAVQQDALISGSAELPAADQASVDEIRRLTDLYTLATLSLADREARASGQRTLSGSALTRSWEALGAARRTDDGDPHAEPSATVAARTEPPPRGAPVLQQIIAEKIAAYTSYNELDRKDVDRLFLRNIDRFYARYPMPSDRDRSIEVQAAFQKTILDVIDTMLDAAQAAARDAGEPLVREPIVARVAHELYPHEVDDLEDVTFFPRLPRDRRFLLESYDMDSFRDFGLHWRLLRNALNRRETGLELDLDPFAAEQLAEMVAQLGVLIFRIAGEIASDTATSADLTAEDLYRAGAALPSLAEMNATAPPALRSMSLASSSSPPLAPGSAFMTDQTEEAGISYGHRTSDWLSRLRRTLRITPPTFSGGGVAAEDVDGDQRIDLLYVGGMGNALYINDGRGGFIDATERAGLDYRRADGYPGEARQPLIADFDNDGRQDVLITYVDDPHRLYRNLGDGRFEDVTDRSGLGGVGLVGGPATTFDFDNDGLLDVYIGYFGNYLEGSIPNPTNVATGDDDDSNYRGDLPTLARDNTNALPNKLFRNLGGLRFAEVENSGTENTGWVQAVAHTDVDLDGLQDLVVANDFGRNAVLRNLGGGRFENIAGQLGMTKAYHSMNVGIGDLNLDGYPDLYISNLNTMLKDTKYVLPTEETVMDSRLETLATMLVQESSVLYTSRAHGNELADYEISEAVERSATSVGWAWDADFFDFDNDGDDDLYVLNGANEYKLFQETWNRREADGTKTPVLRLSHHDQPNIFYVNAGGRLTDASRGSGADFIGNSRSAAYLDYDGDGDLDVAVNNFQSDAVLLRNEAQRWDNGWVKVRLIGDPERGVNSDAIGARMIATTPNGTRIWREIHGGSGYLSLEPKLQHFGLGKEESIDIEILWPNGERQMALGLSARGSYLIEQGKPPAASEPLQTAR